MRCRRQRVLHLETLARAVCDGAATPPEATKHGEHDKTRNSSSEQEVRTEWLSGAAPLNVSNVCTFAGATSHDAHHYPRPQRALSRRAASMEREAIRPAGGARGPGHAHRRGAAAPKRALARRPPPPARLRVRAAAPRDPSAAAAASALLAPPHPAPPSSEARATQPAPRPAPPASLSADHPPLPEHPLLRRGTLANGLRWVVLPNPAPPNRFEAHLEVHAGSVDEGEDEQGLAHLVEHVTFLGSKARERLLGTGARSNAYTDFHHTVFHTHAPTAGPDGEPLLAQAVAALADVAFHPPFSDARIAKERAAVLSEAQMMNTIEYRVDCQLLTHVRCEGGAARRRGRSRSSSLARDPTRHSFLSFSLFLSSSSLLPASQLHWENALGNRFPIGQAAQIPGWSAEQLRSFHSHWYFPANCTLYIVGDVDADEAVAAAEAAFGSVPAAVDAATLRPRARGPHRPPVRHAYGAPPLAPGALPGDVISAEATPRLFVHELLSQFSLSLFCKLPVLPVSGPAALARCFSQRVALAVLQFRLARAAAAHRGGGDGDGSDGGDDAPDAASPHAPSFQSADLDHSDSGREGCCVSTFTVTSEPSDWRAALRAACAEARRLARRGASPAEFGRYKAALLRDSEQLAAQAGTVPSADNLDFVMESDALGHTVMDQVQGHAALVDVAGQVTLQSVNDAAAELLGYIADFGLPPAQRDPRGSTATAVVVCVPAWLPRGEGGDEAAPPVPFSIDAQSVAAVLSEQIVFASATADVVVPTRLMGDRDVEALVTQRAPRFVPFFGPDDASSASSPQRYAPPPPDASSGVALRRLSNGLRVAWKRSTNEPAGASLRVLAPGGRARETAAANGAVALGARTLSESGSAGAWAREQLELFAMANLLTFTFEAADEALLLDAHVAVDGGAGLVAALELTHLMLTAPSWDARALARAKALYTAHVRALPKSLERATRDAVLRAGLGGDGRFLDPAEGDVAALGLDDVRSSIAAQTADPSQLEVVIVGDFDGDQLDGLLLRYLGTLPPPPLQPPTLLPLSALPVPVFGAATSQPGDGRKRDVRIWLRDSDERACAFAGGAAPSRWGWVPPTSPAAAAAAAAAAAPAAVSPPPAAVAASLMTAASQLPAAAAPAPHPLLASTSGSAAPLSSPSPAAAVGVEAAPFGDVASRRAHPLFVYAAQALLTEVINSRLFTTVRDALGLTYDVSFELSGFDRLAAGWFVLSVTSTPEKVDEALAASLRTLRGLGGAGQRVAARELERARTTLLTRHESDGKTDAYLLDMLGRSLRTSSGGGRAAYATAADAHDALGALPLLLSSATVDDIYTQYNALALSPHQVVTAVGTAGSDEALAAKKAEVEKKAAAVAAAAAAAAVMRPSLPPPAPHVAGSADGFPSQEAFAAALAALNKFTRANAPKGE